MSNIIKLKNKTEGFPVSYITSNEGSKIVGVSHPEWSFSIQRNGDVIALVTDDGEPFGVIQADQFNTVLISWLLIDDPELIKKASK